MKAEEKLIKRAQNGDKEAFGQIYDSYAAPIYRFILVRVGNKADAEDLTHQVFLNAWQGLNRYKFRGLPFSSWLYKIAGNALIDFYRTNRRYTDISTLPEDVLIDKPDFGSQADNDMTLKLVRLAMKDLDPDQQSVLTLKFVNDLTNKEIAQILNKSEGAIRVIQHRALKQLRSKINGRARFN